MRLFKFRGWELEIHERQDNGSYHLFALYNEDQRKGVFVVDWSASLDVFSPFVIWWSPN